MKTPSPRKTPTPPADLGTEPIGVDPELAENATDGDSALDDESYRSSTASISSTIFEYRKLHGRTYHNYTGAEYWAPNDDQQNQGLDMAHHMMYLAFDDQLFLAPLKNPQRILDVGTGTGIWAIDFADEFPSCEVIGTDLSPIQPPWVPPNCKFELDNCELDWTFAESSFDYIHIRGLVGCIQDWPALYRQCMRSLKPGGWLEQHEYALPISPNSGVFPPDCIWNAWGGVFRDAGAKMGRTFDITDEWEQWMRDAGFTEPLYRNMVRLPLGDWPADRKWKEVGVFNRANFEQGLDGFASYLCTQVLGWEEMEVKVLLAKVRAALRNRSYQAYYPLKTIHTQKPLVPYQDSDSA